MQIPGISVLKKENDVTIVKILGRYSGWDPSAVAAASLQLDAGPRQGSNNL